MNANGGLFSKNKIIFRAGWVAELVGAESLESCDGTAEDEGVDVVGAFVGIDRLQVHDVADDVVLVRDAVASQHVTALARNVQRLAARVALQQRNHLRRHPSFTFSKKQKKNSFN